MHAHIPEVPKSLSEETRFALQRLDSLSREWQEFIAQANSVALRRRRERSLRRHAIETGILERLYDIDIGTTESLVAEGFTAEVVETSGGIDVKNFETISSQLAALEFLQEAVKEGRDLSPGIIKQIHSGITATQDFYEGRDQFGAIRQIQLEKGQWKQSSNSIVRPDGSVLETVSPLQVPGQVELMCVEYAANRGLVHPIVLTAWLHYSFALIHPFSDGNGRVGRALTLLSLLQADLAPVVVRRENRDAYLNALDAWTEGNPDVLIRFFANLEEAALIAELSPLDEPSTSAAEALQLAASRLNLKLTGTQEEKARATELLASGIQGKIEVELSKAAEELSLIEISGTRPRAWVSSGRPGEEKGNNFKIQIIRAAKNADFYTNLAGGTWWVSLTLGLGLTELKYLCVVQKAGHYPGVLAVTAAADMAFIELDEEGSSSKRFEELLASNTERVNLVFSDSAEERWPDVKALIDLTLHGATMDFVNLL